MNNLKDIHNYTRMFWWASWVVLSGFQWTIWRIYTTDFFEDSKRKSLFYQDFNEQFEGYTQLILTSLHHFYSCFIRISMNNLKDIHNIISSILALRCVVLSGFQWTIWRIYTTKGWAHSRGCQLFYQDFNEQFEGYTQPSIALDSTPIGCFIRISMNNLKDIHNLFWKQPPLPRLFYQDFNEQFEGYTQPVTVWTVRHNVVLSGFQWTIWRIYTTLG